MEKKWFTNGRLYIDGKLEQRNIVAANGRIAAIYDKDYVIKNRAAQIIDLQNMVVLPGFTDCHIHLLDYAISMSRVNLSRARSEQEAVSILLNKSQKYPRSAWLIGRGWSCNNWGPPQLPTRKSLDQYFPDNPVVLISMCGHLLWLNSMALKLCGINQYTADPPGGKIDREQGSSQPTGILRENATAVAYAKIKRPARSVQKQLLKKVVGRLHRLGLSALHIHEDAEAFSLLQELQGEDNLNIRCLFFLPDNVLDDLINLRLQSGFGNEWLQLGGIKIFVDGSLGGRTAFMKRPYTGEKTYRGIPVIEYKELKDRIYQANKGGLAVAVHAIGDAAVAHTLNTLKYARNHAPQATFPKTKNRIEHFQVVDPKDLPFIVSLDMVASVQPAHLFQDWRAADRLWGQRSRFAYAFKTLKRSRALLCFGSDAPVENPNPFWGLYAAVLRQDINGQPAQGWHPKERLNLPQALQAYTVNPAKAEGSCGERGTICQGKFCDFIVLPEDIFSCAPENIKNLRVAMTVIGGEIVYRGF